MKSPRRAFLVSVLGLLGLLLYLPSALAGFTGFDDVRIVLEHPRLFDESSFLASLHEIFVAGFPREEPLLFRDLTWAVDSYTFGHRNPLGYHLGNVVLNAINGGLVFIWLQLLTRRGWEVFVVSATFVVLPVHAEPVTWIMGRKDVLVAFFMLAALIAHVAWLDHDPSDHRSRRALYGLTFVATVLALLSKLSAISLVPLLVLQVMFRPMLNGARPVDAPLERDAIVRHALPLIPHAVATGLVFVWYQGVLRDFGVFAVRGPSIADPSHAVTLFWTSPWVLASYLRLLVWPFEYSALYSWPSMNIALETWHYGGALMLWGGAVAAVYLAFRRRRDLLFFLLGFAVLMIPYLNLVYIGIWIANRYIYLSSLFLLAMLVFPIADGVRNRPAWGRPLVIAWVLFASLCVHRTLIYEAVWDDGASLWGHEVTLPSPPMMAFFGLASLKLEQAGQVADPQAKASLLEQAESTIDAGIAHYEGLDLVPTTYFCEQPVGYSKLNYLRAIARRARGASVQEQLELHLRAWEAYDRNAINNLRLGEIYLGFARRAASADAERTHVDRSFFYFSAFVRAAHREPKHRDVIVNTLSRVYEANFPWLRPAIERIRGQYGL